MIRSILAAIDGSPRAPAVLEAVAALSDAFGAIVYPFRAIFVPPEFPASAAGSLADPLPAHLESEAMADFQRLGLNGLLPMAATPIVRSGQPWRLILNVSDELDIDLIVLGSHGYHGIDRVLGTTAARVVNMSKRNVFVVHGRSTAAPAAAGPFAGSKGRP